MTFKAASKSVKTPFVGLFDLQNSVPNMTVCGGTLNLP